MTNEKTMTEGKPFGILWRFAVPMMLGNAFQLLYTLADSAIAGRLLGLQAFAALGATGFAYWLVLSVILGITQGFGTVLSQRYGAGGAEGMRRVYGAALVLTGLLGLLLSCALPLLATPLLRLLQTPEDILPDASRYLRLMLAGTIITFLYNTLATAFRAVGDSKTPLYALLIASIANIALDVLLVLWTPLGVVAIALATLLAQCIACGYCLWRMRGLSALSLHGVRQADFASSRALLRIGLPMGLRNCVIALGGLVMQSYINGYGVHFIAGIAAAGRLNNLLSVVASALDGAIAVFVAQNYGAGKWSRIREGIRSARRAMLVSAAVLIALLFWLGRPLLSLMLSGEAAMVDAVLDVATLQLRVNLLTLPVLYMLYLYRSALQGMGNAAVPLLSGFVELAARLAMLVALSSLLREWSVYLAEPAGWLCAALLLYFSYRKYSARLMQKADA